MRKSGFHNGEGPLKKLGDAFKAHPLQTIFNPLASVNSNENRKAEAVALQATVATEVALNSQQTQQQSDFNQAITLYKAQQLALGAGVPPAGGVAPTASTATDSTAGKSAAPGGIPTWGIALMVLGGVAILGGGVYYALK